MNPSDLLLSRALQDSRHREDSVLLSSIEDAAASYLLENQPLKALNLIHEALSIRRRLSPDQLTPSSLAYIQVSTKTVSAVAMSLLDQGDLGTSLQVLLKLEEELKAFPLSPLAAERCSVLNNLACVYRKSVQFSQARKCLGKALRLCESFKDTQMDRAGTHLNMCAVLSNQNRHDSALEFGRKAVQYAQEDVINRKIDGDPEETHVIKVLAVAYFNVAAEFEHIRQYSTALDWYRKAVNVIVDSQRTELNSLLDTLYTACKTMRKKVLEKSEKSTKIKGANRSRPQSARRSEGKSSESGSFRPASAARPHSGRVPASERKLKTHISNTGKVVQMPPLGTSRRIKKEAFGKKSPISEGPIKAVWTQDLDPDSSIVSRKTLLTCLDWEKDLTKPPSEGGRESLESLSRLGLLDFLDEKDVKIERKRLVRVRGNRKKADLPREDKEKIESGEGWDDDRSEGQKDIEEISPIDLPIKTAEIQIAKTGLDLESAGVENLHISSGETNEGVKKTESIVLMPSETALLNKVPTSEIESQKYEDSSSGRLTKSRLLEEVPMTQKPPFLSKEVVPLEVPSIDTSNSSKPKKKSDFVSLKLIETVINLQKNFRARLAKDKFKRLLIASNQKTQRTLVLRRGRQFPNGVYGIVSVFESKEKVVFSLNLEDGFELEIEKTAEMDLRELLGKLIFDGKTLSLPQEPKSGLLRSETEKSRLLEFRITRFQALFRGKLTRNVLKLSKSKGIKESVRKLVYRSGVQLNSSVYGLVMIYKLPTGLVQIVIQPSNSDREYELITGYEEKDYFSLAKRVRFNGVSVSLTQDKSSFQESIVLKNPVSPPLQQEKSQFSPSEDPWKPPELDEKIQVLVRQPQTLSGFQYMVSVTFSQATELIELEAERISAKAPILRKTRIPEMAIRASFNLPLSTDLQTLGRTLVNFIAVEKGYLTLNPPSDV